MIHRTNTDDNLRAVVVDVAADRRTGRPTTRALGYVLRASADRPVGGLVLRRLHGYSGVRKCWMVEIQADKADQADPPLGTCGEDSREDGDRAPGPSASSALSASSASNADDARRLVETQIGRPLDDEEWQQIATVLAVFPDSEVTVDG